MACNMGHNKIDEYFKSLPLYINGFRMIGNTCISVANLLKSNSRKYLLILYISSLFDTQIYYERCLQEMHLVLVICLHEEINLCSLELESTCI